MWIKKEYDYNDLRTNSWSGAEITLRRIEEANKEEELMNFLEDIFYENIPTATEVNDVLWFFPRRYADRRELCEISALMQGRNSVIVARVTGVSSKRSIRTGTHVCLCEAADDTGTVSIVWFNRKGLDNILKQGMSIAIFGLPSFCDGRIEFLKDSIMTVSFAREGYEDLIDTCYYRIKGDTLVLSSKIKKRYEVEINDKRQPIGDGFPVLVKYYWKTGKGYFPVH